MPRRKGGNVLTNAWAELKSRLPGAQAREQAAQAAEDAKTAEAKAQGTGTVYNTAPRNPSSEGAPAGRSLFTTGRPAFSFGARRKTLRTKFDRCIKSVRKTVKARKGSTKESAAIAICTTTVLHPRGKTLKRYRKGRLTTQRKFRGGELPSADKTLLQQVARVTGVPAENLETGKSYSLDGKPIGRFDHLKPAGRVPGAIFKTTDGPFATIAYSPETRFLPVPGGSRRVKSTRRR